MNWLPCKWPCKHVILKMWLYFLFNTYGVCVHHCVKLVLRLKMMANGCIQCSSESNMNKQPVLVFLTKRWDSVALVRLTFVLLCSASSRDCCGKRCSLHCRWPDCLLVSHVICFGKSQPALLFVFWLLFSTIITRNRALIFRSFSKAFSHENTYCASTKCPT